MAQEEWTNRRGDTWIPQTEGGVAKRALEEGETPPFRPLMGGTLLGVVVSCCERSGGGRR